MAATKGKPSPERPPDVPAADSANVHNVGGRPARHFVVVWDSPLGKARIDWEAESEDQVRREFIDHCLKGLTITPR